MRDRVLVAARWLVLALRGANWLAVALFAVAIGFSLIGHGTLTDILIRKYGAGFDAGSAVFAMQAVMLLGIAIAAPVHIIFTALLRMLASVEAGDPFIEDNARRLHSIGWALLAIQLGDLAFGATTVWFARLGLESGGWSPSIAGWIGVVMAFVLARVFAIGARMRDELAMTV